MSPLTLYITAQVAIASALWLLFLLAHWWDRRRQTLWSFGWSLGAFCAAATFTGMGVVNVIIKMVQA